MIRHHHLITIAMFLSGLFSSVLVAAEPIFESIFDGATLQGWSGDSKLWSVQDGTITGVTTDEAPLECR